jgi:hypothetical protein
MTMNFKILLAILALQVHAQQVFHQRLSKIANIGKIFSNIQNKPS